MTSAEIDATPCPACGAVTDAACLDECTVAGEYAAPRMLAARAHRVRDVCRNPKCRAPAGTWCHCVERMDDAQPGATGPAQGELFR